MCDERRFILGEQKYIDFTVRANRKNDVIVITDARYELKHGHEVVDSGSCIVDGTDIRVLLNPHESGFYRLVITVEIPPETVKYAVEVSCEV